MAGTCWISLWWQRRNLYRRSPMRPIIPRQGLHFSNDRLGYQNRWHRVVLCAESLVQSPAVSALLRRWRCCVLPQEFSALAFSCLKFLHVLINLPESIVVFDVLSRVTIESFSLPFKRQTDSDEYDVTRLNVHELQKFNLAKCSWESLKLQLFYLRKLKKTHVWPNKK